MFVVFLPLPCAFPASSLHRADEFIKERERYAEIGDDLDFAFVELIPGIGIVYNERHPKPPTPEHVKTPTPDPEVVAAAAAAVAAAQAAADAAAAQAALEAAAAAEALAAAEAAAALAALPPPPFDYRLDLPPEAAECPFVRNYSPPRAAEGDAAAPPAAEPAPAAAAEEAPAADAPAS